MIQAMLDLVRLQVIIPELILDLVYATPRNFTGQPVYPAGAGAYLCARPAERLKRVQKRLQKQRLQLKVFDAYRPLSVQKIFWTFLPHPLYVADQRIGSCHNRGAALDVTLVDAQGQELPMPSGFDDFTERAHQDFEPSDSALARNRALLREAMEQEGFIPYANEWWHFDDPEWASYPLLDISFEELS